MSAQTVNVRTGGGGFVGGGVGSVTVSDTWSLSPSTVARMFATPAWAAVTFPPAVTVATTVLDDDQTAEPVTFSVVPSESVVVAVNCAEAPTARLDDPVTATDVTVGVGSVTASDTWSLSPSTVARMFATPAWAAVTFPPAVTVATTVLDDDQTAEPVTFSVVPSESVVVAVNCAEAPTARLDDPVTTTDVTVGVGVASVVVVGETGLSSPPQATAGQGNDETQDSHGPTPYQKRINRRRSLMVCQERSLAKNSLGTPRLLCDNYGSSQECEQGVRPSTRGQCHS